MVNFYFTVTVASCVSQYLYLKDTGSTFGVYPLGMMKGKLYAHVQKCQTRITSMLFSMGVFAYAYLSITEGIIHPHPRICLFFNVFF